jgi:hypothetical protein
VDIDIAWILRKTMTYTKHQLEKIGEAFIAKQLYGENLQIAYPDIDTGIDLIVYKIDVNRHFNAVPVQIKAFSGEEFYTDIKYLNISGLFIVYLWYIGTDKPVRAFGMKYIDAERIVDERRWSRKEGKYARTRGTSTLSEALAPFEIQCWEKLFFNKETLE